MDAWAMRVLDQYGMIGVMIVIMIEYCCFPMPSEVLLPFAGFILAASRTPLALAVACSVLAGVVGSCICYCIAAWWGNLFTSKILNRFPKASEALEKTMKWQHNMGGLSVMIARVIPIFRTWVSFAAGFARQPFGTFALYSTIGIILWNTMLLGSGYYLYQTGIAMASSGMIWLMPLIVAVAVACVLLFRKWRKKNREKAEGEPDMA